MNSKGQQLERATRIIHSDPEIMGGTSVFRGTRIPVYVVADMIERGTRIEEILARYRP